MQIKIVSSKKNEQNKNFLFAFKLLSIVKLTCPLCIPSRYYIKGPKTGVYDLFTENLPGLPDNIRRRKEGGYWLGLAGIRKWPFSLLDFLGPYPTIKKMITKVNEKFSLLLK